MGGFSFKQFYVAHDKCGMKVTTDSVVLGAWANVDGVTTALDIGTGSGILTLFLAQRLAQQSNFEITAVEIEPDAAAQAQSNFAQSPWSEHLHCIQTDICAWQTTQKFDLIISNPPYFSSGQTLECAKRQAARLEDSLSFEQLFATAKRIAHENTRLAMIIPAVRISQITELSAAAGWFLARQLHIISRHGKHSTLVAQEFTQHQKETGNECLIIRDSANNYTSQFMSLTQNFYLNF